eukprot:1508042-Pyramimonas_sp.AAC.1
MRFGSTCGPLIGESSVEFASSASALPAGIFSAMLTVLMATFVAARNLLGDGVGRLGGCGTWS